MFNKKISLLFALCSALLLTACNGARRAGGPVWQPGYAAVPITPAPTRIQTDFNAPDFGMFGSGLPHYAPPADIRNIAVLLPLSGPAEDLGRGIKTAIELAMTQRRQINVNMSFHDLSGNRAARQSTIANVIAASPDAIIGPIFAEDVLLVRDAKPADLPVISFTSDVNSLGGGVMTMALMPSQSVEEIVREAARNNSRGIVIFAPKSPSGELMAGAATMAANMHNVPTIGLFFYTEGDINSMRAAARRAAMYDVRLAANIRAREILSEISLDTNLTPAQRVSNTSQLDRLSRTNTVGTLPYDSVLFLGNAPDSRMLGSFMRYFDVGPRDAMFFGTAMWDGSELLGDLTFTGAHFAALPTMNADFARMFTHITGAAPSRLDTFGFDAATLTLAMIHSNQTAPGFLLNPSGYLGIDGLYRLRPNGVIERALQVMTITGGGAARLHRAAVNNFMTPLYHVPATVAPRGREIEITRPTVNPINYIDIPPHWQPRFGTRAQVIAPQDAHRHIGAAPPQQPVVIVMGYNDEYRPTVVQTDGWQPLHSAVERHLIDEIVMN